MLDFVRIMRSALPNYIVRKPGEKKKKKSAAESNGSGEYWMMKRTLRNLLSCTERSMSMETATSSGRNL